MLNPLASVWRTKMMNHHLCLLLLVWLFDRLVHFPFMWLDWLVQRWLGWNKCSISILMGHLDVLPLKDTTYWPNATQLPYGRKSDDLGGTLTRIQLHPIPSDGAYSLEILQLACLANSTTSIHKHCIPTNQTEVCDIIYILSLVSAEITDGRTTGCPVNSQANEGSLPFSVRERRIASLLYYLTNLHYRGGNNVFLRRTQVLSVSLYILTKEQTPFALSIISNTDSINNSVYSKSLSIYFHQIGYKPTHIDCDRPCLRFANGLLRCFFQACFTWRQSWVTRMRFEWS